MKHAFTMIELVFVIVILGILAAVALPRLTATRNDAEISKMANLVVASVTDIANYAVSNVRTENNLSEMSNTLDSLERIDVAVIDTTNKKATIKVGDISDCVVFKVETNNTTDNLSLEFNDPQGDVVCVGLQSTINADDYPIRLRGGSVAR